MTRRSAAAAAPAPTIPKIPPTQVLSRLAALQAAPTVTLKQQWRELFGKESGVHPEPAGLSNPGARLWRAEARNRRPACGARLATGWRQRGAAPYPGR
jgi:hypothetical protein